MLTLGIESSCDETAFALVRDGELIDSVISTQVDIHALFGGVVPEIASREHYRLIGYLYDSLLARTGIDTEQIDNVAVSRGPGLLGSLLVGVGFAKGLVAGTSKKLIGVNHLHAHLLAAGLEQDIQFPVLGLLVSGGHTQIYLIRSADDFVELGKTLDDAAGEAFDKVAKMLNMPYPGGKYIDQLGRLATPDKKRFTRPYLDNKNLNFSFSGLKTALSLYIEAHSHLKLPSLNDVDELFNGTRDVTELAELCASFNFTVADTLRVKMQRAIDQRKEQGDSINSIIVAGGVAANSVIRETMADLAKSNNVALTLPSFNLCTDNASMVAYMGEQLILKGYSHGLDLDAIPRGRKIPQDYLHSLC
ncbi:tRNA (adenosine(37)-N6)-threonylcarbamoyltransferase complex transferase subunit TsaD [Halodesulfovibrio marinisediminis]|uniref:tRNA N6-adenosine threonylcarbamoyltransferase n=1 Tax=Halodesulfovibrio marinisediminis DSM 17456 TaxID=1121457 RepID=A0A1N6E564_9BACT|nr:tRNA (adenosine(37)-N6)-threonylcarbamoyltransferase complex transferase subunit TsaD [Halodesulfovibrio marinisediminis]SIN78149.1 N6-L-threonylcarbamoyladenine synthase [Halodesulfovibrio marinisediminis DSM 17456]